MIVGHHLVKRYPGGFEAIRDISLEIAAGEIILIGGHSGAGKTTLLKLLGAIERPTTGTLVAGGQNLTTLKKRALPFLRRNLGLVFQDQKLLFDRTALENVCLPLEIIGLAPREAERRARAALDKVGLLAREKAHPIALSGGEQQRLAIARAVVNRPSILLADEPTANLDEESARQVLNLFAAFNRAGVTVVIATHAPREIPGKTVRFLTLDHGCLQP
jgi:cell division transport system ATP-binding protein